MRKQYFIDAQSITQVRDAIDTEIIREEYAKTISFNSANSRPTPGFQPFIDPPADNFHGRDGHSTIFGSSENADSSGYSAVSTFWILIILALNLVFAIFCEACVILSFE